MEILCLGLSHHTAPVDLRERFAIPDGEVASAAVQLRAAPGVSEAVVVSTCNRVEIYLAADETAAAFSAVSDFLAARASATPEGEHFFRHATAHSVRHLFRVVSGLDSMVLGETEILGQVKKAYAAAQGAGATAKHLNKLFQRAFNVAKEVRTKTNITRGSVSVGSVAVELAEKIFGQLKSCKVMILGAGEMSELTAGALSARGVHSIFVANRSFDRAQILAEKMRGQAVHFDEWPQHFAGVDILIGSTAAPHHVLTAAQLAPIMRTRQDRPLFCIDLAVPRDIEPAVNALEGVYLYDIDSLQKIADESMNVRRQELTVCEQMIERHAVEFGEWLAGGWQAAAVRYSQVASGRREVVIRCTLGTRASALAIAQVELTRAALLREFPALDIAVQSFVTRGDKKLELSLIRAAEAGGKGLFTRELEDALLAGRIDIAVHSLKDLPGHNPPGLDITAVLPRAATADVLLTREPLAFFEQLPLGSAIGTSSIRRARQLRHLRPDLVIEDWRGNVQTRLRKLTERTDIAGIVLAQAGLDRLGFDCASGTIATEVGNFHTHSLAAYLLPAIGQGAIALQSRADRPEVAALLARIDHAPTHLVIRAERELQRLLAGDCSLPIGVRTTLEGDTLRMDAILFPPDELAPPTEAHAEGPAHQAEAIAARLFAGLAPGS